MITAEKLQYLSDVEKRIYKMIDSCETHYHTEGTRKYIHFFERMLEDKFEVSDIMTCEWKDHTLVSGVIADVRNKLREKISKK
jgi:hypothetical protein